MFESIFIYAALIGGIFLAIQFAMVFMGIGEDGGDAGGVGDGMDQGADHWSEGADGDFDVPDGRWFFEMFSLRSLAGAALFFGLVGKTALAFGVSQTSAVIYAAVAGGVALYAIYWIFKQVFRLESSGNEDVRNAVGLPAKVYVPIPAAGSGAGKVQFKMQGRLVEYEAVSEDSAPLSTGQHVVITGVVSSNTVRVTTADTA